MYGNGTPTLFHCVSVLLPSVLALGHPVSQGIRPAEGAEKTAVGAATAWSPDLADQRNLVGAGGGIAGEPRARDTAPDR